MTYQDKLQAIREQMNELGVSAYIIPSSDPHINEYLPDHYKCIAFASGFTGSAGTLIITRDFAGLWTDSRYFEQAQQELEGSGYELVKLKVQHSPEYIDWLEKNIDEGGIIAYNDRLISVLLGELLEKRLGTLAVKQITFKNVDFLAPIWPERPPLPNMPAFCLDENFTGQSIASKLNELRTVMNSFHAEQHFLSSLDDIAWLFNLRGNDISYNPLALCFALIGLNQASLFIQPDKLNAENKQTLEEAGVNLLPYDAIDEALRSLGSCPTLLIDPKRNCFGLFSLIPKTVKIIQATNPTTHFKALKNIIELEQIRWAMIRDGIALTRFFIWLEKNIGKIKISEISAADKLAEFRALQEGFVGLSFTTIAAYQAHGALPHYSANSSSNVELLEEGLFLVDSGGQYQYGTTDVTRVIPLGVPTEEEKFDYTLVLKAMIEGSKAIYLKGTCGYQLDAICRKPLWEHQINYGHGTGHGVGYYLNVHEGPQVFNPTNVAVALEPGMVTSIEPGVYRPGKRGIRIENLVLCVENTQNEFGEFYSFETLTLAPIHTNLIQKNILESSQIEWLNAYHTKVRETLSPHLTSNEQDWLKNQTKAL